MESNIKSSFIPKSAPQIGTSIPRALGTNGFTDLVMLISTVLFVASIALAIAVFLYVSFLQTSLASKENQLKRAQDAFEPTLIAELTRLDDRMKAGEDLLEKHTATSIIFAVLEQLTLETISFRNFAFDATAEEPTIKMAGIARSVNSIALQADVFGKHTAVVSPIFSNIGRETGGVRFDFNAKINPSAIRYSNLVLSALQQQSGTGQIPTQGTTTEQENSIPLFNPPASGGQN